MNKQYLKRLTKQQTAAILSASAAKKQQKLLNFSKITALSSLPNSCILTSQKQLFTIYLLLLHLTFIV